MRLYLSSFLLGTDAGAFRRLARGPRVGLVLNALDNVVTARADWRQRQGAALSALGFEVQEIDLRRFFGAPDRLAETLEGLDALWINGGNTFILRRAMRESGFDGLIGGMLREDRIAYGGFSAGVVVLHQSLKGLETVDDPDDVPEGYPAATPWDGLGILPFSVVVHYRSGHSESEAVEDEVRFYEENDIPYRTLRDGEAFVVEGGFDTLRLVGAPA